MRVIMEEVIDEHLVPMWKVDNEFFSREDHVIPGYQSYSDFYWRALR